MGLLTSLGMTHATSAKTHFTTRCSQFGHPEFQITVSSSSTPRADVEWFLSVLEGMVAAGERFRAGETMQVGWMITMLQRGDQDALKVTEPDMRAIPIKFIDAVDATINHLRTQKYSVESVFSAASLVFPSLRQSVVVHVNYKQSKRILLDRASPQGTDSGWWLSDLEDQVGAKDPNQFTKISMYQLGVDRPDLIKFFAFPAGLQVAIDRRIGIIKDGHELPIASGSFLDQLNRRGNAL